MVIMKDHQIIHLKRDLFREMLKRDFTEITIKPGIYAVHAIEDKIVILLGLKVSKNFQRSMKILSSLNLK